MTWVVWRQHRTESFIAAAVLALLAVFLLTTGQLMAHTYQQSGLSACLAHSQDSGVCSTLRTAFMNQYGPLLAGALALLVLPVLLGTLVGAPLVAREFEDRTYVLAWMQSVTRLRWLTTSMGLVLGTGLLATAVLGSLVMWWYRPFAQIIGNFPPGPYDFSGPVFPATAVLALALGVVAGALTRRTVPAIFLTLVLLLLIRLPVELFLRPNFEPPLSATWPIARNSPVNVSNRDWTIAQGYLDAHGNFTNGIRCTSPNQTPQQCLTAGGYRNHLVYQPANRYWTFQWIETSIYLAFSALAVVLSFWLIGRRGG